MYTVTNKDSTGLADCLAHLKIEVAMDLVLGTPMYRRNGGEWEPLDDTMQYVIQDEIARLCKVKVNEDTYQKIYFSGPAWKRALSPLLHKNGYHLTRDWVNSYSDAADKLTVEQAEDTLAASFARCHKVDTKTNQNCLLYTSPSPRD